jgi:hypothetical protein
MIPKVVGSIDQVLEAFGIALESDLIRFGGASTDSRKISGVKRDFDENTNSANRS